MVQNKSVRLHLKNQLFALDKNKKISEQK